MKRVAFAFIDVEFDGAVVVGVAIALALLLSMIVTLGGLIVIVDLINVVLVLSVPVLASSTRSLFRSADVEEMSPWKGIIQNSADTNPPLLCSS